MATAVPITTGDGKFRLAGEDAPRAVAALAIILGLALGQGAAGLIGRASRMTPVAPSASSDAGARAPAAPIEPPPKPQPPDWAGVPPSARTGAEGRPPLSGPASPEPAQQAGAAPLGAGANPAREGAAPRPACPPAVAVPFKRCSARVATEWLEGPTAPLRAWLAAHPDAVLSIQGHTDSTGAESYNVLLSYARAKTVADWLRNAGVAPRQLAVAGAGSRPARIAEADNRLAVLEILGVDLCADAPKGTP